MAKPKGVWANMHAKQKRIDGGSGETMRKKGAPGAPTEKALKAAGNSPTTKKKKATTKTKGTRKKKIA